MAVIFRPASRAAAAVKGDAIKLASTLKNNKGVASRIQDGFVLRAIGNGKHVTVYVMELPPMLGSVMPFYYRPNQGWPVMWMHAWPGDIGALESVDPPIEAVPSLVVSRPTNASYFTSSGEGAISVNGASPAGLASSVYAGAFVRRTTTTSFLSAIRCTGALNDAGTFGGLYAGRPIFPGGSSPPQTPTKLVIISINWPYMAGGGQTGYGSGIEWGSKNGLLAGSAFNNGTYDDLYHAAIFRYAVTQAEPGGPYALTVTHSNDWKDATLKGVVWAKNAGFNVTNADLEVDPAAADAMLVIEKRSNHREVVTAYQRHFIPVDCPQTPEAPWGGGEYCTAQAPVSKGNSWPTGYAYTQVQIPAFVRDVFDYQTCVVTSHPDGTTTEIVLSQRSDDTTDLSRTNDTSYTAVFGVNTLAGEPRLLCAKVVRPLNKVAGTALVEHTFIAGMHQNSCTDNDQPPPDDGQLGSTVLVPSGITFNSVDTLEAPPYVFLPDLDEQQTLDAFSLVLVAPSGGETIISMSGYVPMSYGQSQAGVTYCAYAPGLFAVAVFSSGQAGAAQRSLQIMVFSAATGAPIASSPVLFSVGKDDIVSITCAKVGTLDPNGAGETIEAHASILLTITPIAYKNSPYTPAQVPLYTVNNLSTVNTVANAPAGSPVFTLGNPLALTRKGAVPRQATNPL